MTRIKDRELMVDVSVAARTFNMSERKLRRAIAAGHVKALRYGKRETYVYLPDVAAWQLAT